MATPVPRPSVYYPVMNPMWPSGLEPLLGVAIGLGLAAAAGFRVFVPLLAAGLAGATGVIPMSPGFTWLASTPVLVALATAVLVEIGAYYVPWLDHLLDVIATPTALVAGMLATASVVVDLPPLLKWTIVLLGGGAAGLTQGASVLTRVKALTVSGGAANPVVSTAELFGAVVLSALAILLPVVALLAVVTLIVLAVRRFGGLLVPARWQGGERKTGRRGT
jgi:hypothetical protein